MSGEAGRSGPVGWALVALQFALLGVLGVEVLRSTRAPWPVLLPGMALIAGGGAFIALASRRLGRRLRAHPAPHEETVLRTDGVYGVVRHPIYLGLLLGATGAMLLARTPRAALAVGALGALLQVKARLEERLLAARFPEYARYARRVPRILPRP